MSRCRIHVIHDNIAFSHPSRIGRGVLFDSSWDRMSPRGAWDSFYLLEALRVTVRGAAAQKDYCNQFEESGPGWRNCKEPLIEEYTGVYPRNLLKRTLSAAIAIGNAPARTRNIDGCITSVPSKYVQRPSNVVLNNC